MFDARTTAVKALCKTIKDQSWSNLVIDKFIKENKLDTKEAAFATVLFYGALERRITLDKCIEKYSKTKLKKLALPVHMVLQTGIYQIMYLDNIRDNTAVNESVNTIKKLKLYKSAGFVNAVLRAFVKDGKNIPVNDSMSSREKLSIEYSVPEYLINLWQKNYGRENTKIILENSLGKPPMSIRINTNLIKKEDLIHLFLKKNITVKEDDILENCLVLANTNAVYDLDEFKNGYFHVQDKASQLCVESFLPRENMRILDMCSAPGGKAFTMAQYMHNKGEIVACDIHAHRVKLIQDNAQRLKIDIINTKCLDMCEYNNELGKFDIVLLDVPCSGLGVIRRKPEIKYKPESLIASFAQMQTKLLNTAANYVKKGGKLIYSTCTLNPNENDVIIDTFLKNNKDCFKKMNLPQMLGGDYKTTLFGNMNTDGFFIAHSYRV